MGVGEQNALLKELIHVRRLDLRVSAHRALPIVQVIDRNKKNVWFFRRAKVWQQDGESQKQNSG